MTKAQKYLVRYLGQILRGQSPDLSGLPHELTAADILFCAKSNSVLHIVYNSVCEASGSVFSETAFQAFEMQTVMNEANQSHAWLEFIKASETERADILMLKGVQIKGFYPSPESRDMCDIDILYKPEQTEKIEKIFTSLGYKKGKITTCHVGWFNENNGVTFEAHHILNSENDENSGYFSGIWSRAVREDGFEHIYSMTPEGLYVHLVMHIAAHIRTNSALLRQLADLYLVKRSEGFDISKAREYLDELNLTELSDNLSRLAQKLFEEGAIEEGDALYDLAEYFFGNLKFGGFDFTQSLEAYRSGGSKIKSFFRQIFPDKSKIFNAYPFIAKRKYLLPAGYILRLFQIIGIRKKNAEKKLKLLGGVTPDSAKQGQKTAEFFEKYGINY